MNKGIILLLLTLTIGCSKTTSVIDYKKGIVDTPNAEPLMIRLSPINDKQDFQKDFRQSQLFANAMTQRCIDTRAYFVNVLKSFNIQVNEEGTLCNFGVEYIKNDQKNNKLS